MPSLVSERLHWPERELSKKHILSPTDKPVSPSQMCLEKLSSSVLKDLFTTGTSSYNVLMQSEEEERQSPKHSPYRRPKKTVRCASTSSRHDNRHPSIAPLLLSGQEGSGDTRHSHVFASGSFLSSSRPAHSITVLGSTMGLSPRPVARPRKVLSTSPRTKLPSLSKLGTAREGENTVKKLCILTAIKPSNVEKEKAKFFKSDFNYNPKFEYSNPVSPLVLARHNNASDRFLTQVRSTSQVRCSQIRKTCSWEAA